MLPTHFLWKQLLETYFGEKDLKNKVCFCCQFLLLEWCDFGAVWCTQKKNQGAWRMLLKDKAACHTNEVFMVFPIPLHVVWLLAFESFYHSQAIHEAVQNGDFEFSKVEFLG